MGVVCECTATDKKLADKAVRARSVTGYAQGYIWPSTRQRLHKMGKFLVKSRQNAVIETPASRQKGGGRA
jgi:hypothetical protein